MSNVEGEEVGCNLFVVCTFQTDRTVSIYIGVHCGENDASDYVITKKYDKKPKRLIVECCYLEVKELYMGDHMAQSLNYHDMNNNHERSKYNCYFLGDFTIVTLMVVKMGGEFLIYYQYNIEKMDKLPSKDTTKKVTKKVAKKVTKKVAKKVAYKVTK